jgi:arginyl-tRNA synthetase
MTFVQQITDRLTSALVAVVPDLPPGFIPTVAPAADAKFGDYQTNAAMLLAKKLGKNPRVFAAELMAAFDAAGLVLEPEMAGPGFINFRLRPEALTARLEGLLADEKLGAARPDGTVARRLVIDFSGPNVAKAMHVGHIRSTILGDAVARIARWVGHVVVTDNHIGDWGTQFGMLLVAWKESLDREALAADPLGEMERLYKDMTARCVADPAVREAAKAELVKLQAGDVENLAIWKEMIRLSQTQFQAIYGRLGIEFDHMLGESSYNAWLGETVEALAAAGLARESEGALCVFSDRTGPEKDDPFLVSRDGQWHDNPSLVRKADGGFNYTTTDLATLVYRQREFTPDQIVYVTDGRQQLHFRQLFAIFRRWHPEAEVQLSHVWFGAILGDDGRPFKTRSGETVKLADLLDEAEERAFALVSEKNPGLPESERRDIARIIGLGAVKYADLLPNRQSDYIFSWDKMLSFQGNTAPYLQYSYVRARSIFRKLEGEIPSLQGPFVLTDPAERALLLQLSRFAEEVPRVLEDFRPNLLSNYLFETATSFHSFFEACPVLRSEGEAKITRLALCELTSRVIQQGLGLLGINVPERM